MTREKSDGPVFSAQLGAARRRGALRAARSFPRFIDYKLHGYQSSNDTLMKVRARTLAAREIYLWIDAKYSLIKSPLAPAETGKIHT